MKVLLCLVCSFTDRAECWKIFLKSDEILMGRSFSQFNIWNINKAGEWTVNTIFIDGTVQLNDLLSILWHEFPLKLLLGWSLWGNIHTSGLLPLLGGDDFIKLSSPVLMMMHGIFAGAFILIDIDLPFYQLYWVKRQEAGDRGEGGRGWDIDVLRCSTHRVPPAR